MVKSKEIERRVEFSSSVPTKASNEKLFLNQKSEAAVGGQSLDIKPHPIFSQNSTRHISSVRDQRWDYKLVCF